MSMKAIKLYGCSFVCMLLGSQLVHMRYKPLSDLNEMIQEEKARILIARMEQLQAEADAAANKTEETPRN